MEEGYQVGNTIEAMWSREETRKKSHNAPSMHLPSPGWCFPLFEPSSLVQGSPEGAINRGWPPGTHCWADKG